MQDCTRQKKQAYFLVLIHGKLPQIGVPNRIRWHKNCLTLYSYSSILSIGEQLSYLTPWKPLFGVKSEEGKSRVFSLTGIQKASILDKQSRAIQIVLFSSRTLTIST